MHCPTYTVLAGFLAMAVSAAPAPIVNPRQVILGEYTTYCSAHCTSIIAKDNLGPQGCAGLPEANSITATFDDAQGTECK